MVQALKELMKYEMAMLISNDDTDDKSLVRTEAGSRSNHDNVYVVDAVILA